MVRHRELEIPPHNMFLSATKTLRHSLYKLHGQERVLIIINQWSFDVFFFKINIHSHFFIALIYLDSMRLYYKHICLLEYIAKYNWIIIFGWNYGYEIISEKLGNGHDHEGSMGYRDYRSINGILFFYIFFSLKKK